MFYEDLAPDTFHSLWKYFINPLNSLSEMRESYYFTRSNLVHFAKPPKIALFFHLTKNLIQMVLNMYWYKHLIFLQIKSVRGKCESQFFIEFADSRKIIWKAVGPDSRFSLRARTHFFPIKITIQNTVPGLRLEKSFKIIENIRIRISKDHNSWDCLSIRNFIPNEACHRTYEPPCISNIYCT